MDQIDAIAARDGFVKAFTDMMHNETETDENKKGTISSHELYDKFKEVTATDNFKFEELYDLSKSYDFIKGYDKSWKTVLNIEEKNNVRLALWLKLYQLLDVNTADSLLLYALQKYRKKPANLTAFLQDLIMLYFLLYVDDPNGNSRKSINSKLPKLIGTNDPHAALKEDIKTLVLDETLYNPKLTNVPRVSEYIFDKLSAVDLTRSTRKCVARFLLTLCELWCGLSEEKALELLKSDSEIEHIFPANPEENISDCPDYLFRLQNVCLLEREINVNIGNKMLAYDSPKDGKLEGKNSYGSSQYIMPNQFYINEHGNLKPNPSFAEKKNEMLVFEKKQAEQRMAQLKSEIFDKGLFGDMLNSILGITIR